MGFFDLFGIIGSIFAQIASFIGAIFTFLWNVMGALFAFLWNTLVAFGGAVADIFGKAGRFFARFWRDYIKRGVNGLLALYRRLREILHRYLGPVIRILRRIREIIDKWYFKIFGPMLQTIQRIRAILQVFRFFGLEFARKLDERLARLENKLLAPFLAIRRLLVSVTSVLNVLADLDVLLRRAPLLGGIIAQIGTLQRILGWGKDAPLSIADEKRQKQDRERFDLSRPDSIARRHESPEFQDYQKNLRAQLRREYRDVAGREMSPE